MKKTVQRKYVMTFDDLRAAIYFYLKDRKEEPVPQDYKEFFVTFLSESIAEINFSEVVEL